MPYNNDIYFNRHHNRNDNCCNCCDCCPSKGPTGPTDMSIYARQEKCRNHAAFQHTKDN